MTHNTQAGRGVEGGKAEAAGYGYDKHTKLSMSSDDEG